MSRIPRECVQEAQERSLRYVWGNPGDQWKSRSRGCLEAFKRSGMKVADYNLETGVLNE